MDKRYFVVTFAARTDFVCCYPHAQGGVAYAAVIRSDTGARSRVTPSTLGLDANFAVQNASAFATATSRLETSGPEWQRQVGEAMAALA